MYSCTAQLPRLDAVRLIHPDELARLRAAVHRVTGAAAAVAAAAGFAGTMWLMLAGPGFLDGHSSTVDHAPQRVAARGAGQASR